MQGWLIKENPFLKSRGKSCESKTMTLHPAASLNTWGSLASGFMKAGIIFKYLICNGKQKMHQKYQIADTH